jgi:hypothetical protein
VPPSQMAARCAVGSVLPGAPARKRYTIAR